MFLWSKNGLSAFSDLNITLNIKLNIELYILTDNVCQVFAFSNALFLEVKRNVKFCDFSVLVNRDTFLLK